MTTQCETRLVAAAKKLNTATDAVMALKKSDIKYITTKAAPSESMKLCLYAVLTLLGSKKEPGWGEVKVELS